MHHATKAEVAPGVWQIARPPRALGWWAQRKRQRQCRREVGHCWHPNGASPVDWWCCECSGETDGMPPNRCLICVTEPERGRLV